ncbi:hypothetical protein XA68_15830 [Ophiocordyceps unilateralis]|uniref:Uncharacterized protein n=1 Tax=Ophiocordyceps unilateralis TaxID=268505 RepID=A0A2A9P7P3_OPHUN|nr:hypothetical protein XA68_15830 [Ophiocordyceps unilateralis]
MSPSKSARRLSLPREPRENETGFGNADAACSSGCAQASHSAKNRLESSTQKVFVGGFRNRCCNAVRRVSSQSPHANRLSRHPVHSFGPPSAPPAIFFSGRRWVPTPLANGSPTRQSWRKAPTDQSESRAGPPEDLLSCKRGPVSRSW